MSPSLYKPSSPFQQWSLGQPDSAPSLLDSLQSFLADHPTVASISTLNKSLPPSIGPHHQRPALTLLDPPAATQAKHDHTASPDSSSSAASSAADCQGSHPHHSPPPSPTSCHQSLDLSLMTHHYFPTSSAPTNTSAAINCPSLPSLGPHLSSIPPAGTIRCSPSRRTPSSSSSPHTAPRSHQLQPYFPHDLSSAEPSSIQPPKRRHTPTPAERPSKTRPNLTSLPRSQSLRSTSPTIYHQRPESQSHARHSSSDGLHPSSSANTQGLIETGTDKRKVQNRNAQRAFRERKEKKLQELQEQVDELIARQGPLASENQQLKELVHQLRAENSSLNVYKQAFTFTLANDLAPSAMPLAPFFSENLAAEGDALATPGSTIPGVPLRTSPPPVDNSRSASSTAPNSAWINYDSRNQSREAQAALAKLDPQHSLPGLGSFSESSCHSQPASSWGPASYSAGSSCSSSSFSASVAKPSNSATDNSPGSSPRSSLRKCLSGNFYNTSCDGRGFSSESAGCLQSSSGHPPQSIGQANFVGPTLSAQGVHEHAGELGGSTVSQRHRQSRLERAPGGTGLTPIGRVSPHTSKNSEMISNGMVAIPDGSPRPLLVPHPASNLDSRNSKLPSNLFLGSFFPVSEPHERYRPNDSLTYQNGQPNTDSHRQLPWDFNFTASTSRLVIPSSSKSHPDLHLEKSIRRDPTGLTVGSNAASNACGPRSPATDQKVMSTVTGAPPISRNDIADEGQETLKGLPSVVLPHKSERMSGLIDQGVISNEELDGLCESFKSRVTCQEKRDFWNELISVRPDWEPIRDEFKRNVIAKRLELGLSSPRDCLSREHS